MGEDFAHSLADWIEANVMTKELRSSAGVPLTVWTSNSQRAMSTAQYINHPKVAMKCLDDMDYGIFDGMTLAEIVEKMPVEMEARAASRDSYRFPKGESRRDVMDRLEQVIFELERHRAPLLIVAPKSVCRALFKWLIDEKSDESTIKLKQHSIYEFFAQGK